MVGDAYLVHVTDKFPQDSVLRAGVGKCKFDGNKQLTCHEMIEAGIPVVVGRYTLHFTISHVMPPHSGNDNPKNIVIVIPIKNLPDVLKTKFFGAPEDIALFGDGLDLTNLGATVLFSNDMKQEYLNSTFKKALGTKIKEIAFDPKQITVKQAFSEFVKNKGGTEYCPKTLVDNANQQSPYKDYTEKVNGQLTGRTFATKEIFEQYFGQGINIDQLLGFSMKELHDFQERESITILDKQFVFGQGILNI